MPTNPLSGLFVISIDLDQSTSATFAPVKDLLDSHHVGATWVVDDPADARLSHLSEPHEVALRTNKSWAEASVGRTRFYKEFTRLMERAEANGRKIQTLALTDTPIPDYYDLLVRHNISLLRPAPGLHEKSDQRPKLVRFGLYKTPSPIALTAQSWWQQRGTDFAIQRSIRRSKQNRSAVHLQVDLRGMERNALKTLGRALHVASKPVHGIELKAGPLKDLVARLRQPARKAARSILRAA